MVEILCTPFPTKHRRSGTRCNPARTIADAAGMDIQDTLAYASDRKKWRELCRVAAWREESRMYTSWILKRRLHVPPNFDHTSVLDKVRANFDAWFGGRPDPS